MMDGSGTKGTLSEQFYAWEKRGRGWDLFECPVRLEPPFRPFLGHYLSRQASPSDVRRPSLFGGIIESFRSQRTVAPAPPFDRVFDEEPDVQPFAYPGPLSEIGIGFPADLKVSRERATQLLSRIASGNDPVSFELIGSGNSVSLQLVCGASDRPHVCGQLQGYFPEVTLWDQTGFLKEAWQEAGSAAALVDFGLSREFMLPIRTGKDFDVDPFIPLIAALAELRPNEIGIVQILFESAREPWADSILRAASDGDGRSFFGEAPEFLTNAQEKIAHPMLAAVIRIAGRAPEEERAWDIARSIGNAFSQFADPTSNEFIPLDNEDYPDHLHAAHFLTRTSCRMGMLLNVQELVSLVHVPSASVRSRSLRRERSPGAFAGIPDDLRTRHVYIAGATQHGKSTFIERMAVRDMENGHGVCILDPKGDLIKSILHKIPARRAQDTILLQAANPVPIDFMEWHTEQERQTLAADLFQTFLQFSTMTAGDQWLSVLRAVIYTLLDAKNCSFLDINAILVNDKKRGEILARVTNPDILDYWKFEFPQLKKDAAQPIITRMKQFTFTPPLKTLLGSPQAKLNLFDCMETRKIILVDLTGVGRSNGNLIGQLLVSKIQQAAFRRESQPRERRVPFFLYADEFQNFQTSAFDTILSEAGGYKLCLTLANQGLYQLEPKIKDAIFTNVTGAWIVFHIDEKDLTNFRVKALPLDPHRLASLPPHTAFIKVGSADPAIVKTPPPITAADKSYADEIRLRTLAAYGGASEPTPNEGKAATTEKRSGKHDSKNSNGRQTTERAVPNKQDSEFFE